jgi:peptidoglycan-N-acetylglucosamine deacetylase
MRGRQSIVIGILCALVGASMARADVIETLPTTEKVIALTFDACEAGQPVSFDRGVLDYLLDRKIPFTVFATGRFVETNRADVEALSKLDFVDIENHSWSHPNTMNHFTADAVVRQFERAQLAIEDATGRAPQFARFPAGNYNKAGLHALEEHGLKVVHWRWATGDPDPRESAEALFDRVTTKAQPGDIVIFHINGRGVHTAEALPRIVEQLEADGYRFVLISDYIGIPKPREPARREPWTIASLQHALDNWVTRAPVAALSSGLN